MAVTSSPAASKTKVVSAREEEKKNRSKCPGIRLVGGRIYDSENGKTCHQCRQKTRDFTAACKNQKANKPCPIGFCHKCLLNRYGEEAEKVVLLDDWQCPKCRGICNCSFCMKKRGHKPTGILVHTAKVNGFSSVSELLQVNGPENLVHEEITKDLGVSPRRRALSKESAVVSPKRPGKENSFDRSSNMNLHSQNLSPISKAKNSKKTKREELKEVSHCKSDNDASLRKDGQKKPRITKEDRTKEVKTAGKDEGVYLEKKESMKERKNVWKEEVKGTEKNEAIVSRKNKSQEFLKNKSNANGEDENNFAVKKKFKTQVSKGVSNYKAANSTNPRGPTSTSDDKVVNIASHRILMGANCNPEVVTDSFNNGNLQSKTNGRSELYEITKCNGEIRREDIDIEIQLPSGTCLTTVAGIELPPEVVGHALQFLEFCAAFSKVLNLKKGQAEAVIREIINGRRGRRSQYSVVAQFHIELLTLIQEDTGEKSPALSPRNGQKSWLLALGKCVSECQLISKELPSACFDSGSEGYDKLDISEKFKLLNFLCDEALNTTDLRDWIDSQDTKFKESTKKAKEKVLAAKDKEKLLKQKMQDEMAKAIIAKNGARLSIAEHAAIVTQIRNKVDEAHAEMLEAMDMVPKKQQRNDAVRTEPILVDSNGCAFWRLKVYNGQQDILRQDAGTWNSDSPNEKWFVYDAEKKEEIMRYMSSIRSKRIRAQQAAETISIENDEIDL